MANVQVIRGELTGKQKDRLLDVTHGLIALVAQLCDGDVTDERISEQVESWTWIGNCVATLDDVEARRTLEIISHIILSELWRFGRSNPEEKITP